MTKRDRQTDRQTQRHTYSIDRVKSNRELVAITDYRAQRFFYIRYSIPSFIKQIVAFIRSKFLSDIKSLEYCL